MSEFYNNSIFWIETDKIKPNPFQPRKEFDEASIRSLADSVRQYGILQALVVTRKERETPEGGLTTEYELVAGERRLRAAKEAGLSQVPAVIRAAEDSDLMKLELAIIENIQREDLNSVDRAKAFNRLAKEFNFKHNEIAKKVGKSREYVSNTIRILSLPEQILEGLSQGKINEGHTRPLMMLVENPEAQDALFKEIVTRRLNVREAEGIARRIAENRARKKDLNPEMKEIEKELSDMFGTRVQIEKKETGGKISIDFFSDDDLKTIINLINARKTNESILSPEDIASENSLEDSTRTDSSDDEGGEDLYFVKNFSV